MSDEQDQSEQDSGTMVPENSEQEATQEFRGQLLNLLQDLVMHAAHINKQFQMLLEQRTLQQYEPKKKAAKKSAGKAPAKKQWRRSW